VELKVPFGHYRPLFDEFSKDIEEALKTAEIGEQVIPELGKSHKRGLRALAFPVQQAAQRFGEILVKLPEATMNDARTDPYGRYRRDTSFSTRSDEEDNPRDKRQIETILGFGASIVGFVSELFRQREVSRIKQDLTRMERNQNQIMDRQKMLIQTTIAQSKTLEQHNKWIQENRKLLHTLTQLDQARVYAQLASFSNVIQQETSIFADTVKLAQLGKLNPDQIGYEQLLSITEYIWDLEQEKALKSPIGKMADLFSMPLSYLYNLEQERLEFIIHIPLTRESSILNMYEYFPFPMKMTNDRPSGGTQAGPTQRPGLQSASRVSNPGSLRAPRVFSPQRDPLLLQEANPQNRLVQNLPLSPVRKGPGGGHSILRLPDPTS